MKKKELSLKIHPLIKKQASRGNADEVSLEALSSRWEHWFENLPDPDQQSEQMAKEVMNLEEEKRVKRMLKNTLPSMK